MARPELRVVDDLALAGAALFVEAAPRTMSLAGGSTPRPLYERLVRTKYPWGKVDVFFGDERCVPAQHPDSNYGMAYRALLSKVPAWPHPMRGCNATQAEVQLRAAFDLPTGVPRLDLALLGLGEDGHTASLFPGHRALDETERLVVRVNRPDHPRLTMTLPVLSAARLAVFLVEGERKRDALRRLLDGDRGIPAARVDAERVVVLANRAAARRG